MTDKHRMTDEQLGRELKSLISGRVESVTPPAGTFLSIQDRLGTQDRDLSPVRLISRLVPGNWGLPMFTGTFVKIAAAVIVAVAIAAVLVFQGRDTDQENEGVQPAAEPTATEPTAEASGQSTDSSVDQTGSKTESSGNDDLIAVNTGVTAHSFPAWDGEAVWVTSRDLGDMVRVSPTGEILLRQRVGGIPNGITTDGESVWVSDSSAGRITRFDLEGNELGRFNFISPSGIQYEDGGLWIHSSNSLSRYDLDGNEQFKLIGVGFPAIGEGRVYSTENDQLVIYGSSGEQMSTTTIPISVDGQARFVTYSGGSVWLVNEPSDLLVRYDLDGNETARWSVAGSARHLYVDGDILWLQLAEDASTSGNDLVRIDLSTGESEVVIRDIEEGRGLIGAGKYFQVGYVTTFFIVDKGIKGDPIAPVLTVSDGDGSAALGTGVSPEDIRSETEAQALVEFPGELQTGSEPLDAETVQELWRNYLIGSRTTGVSRAGTPSWNSVDEICGDGTGVVLYSMTESVMTGATFSWELFEDTAGSWNSVGFRMRFDDPDIAAFRHRDGDHFNAFLGPPGSNTREIVAYESPSCE